MQTDGVALTHSGRHPLLQQCQETTMVDLFTYIAAVHGSMSRAWRRHNLIEGANFPLVANDRKETQLSYSP